jgi:hypothetical protein
VAQSVDPEFKPQYHKKEKKKERRGIFQQILPQGPKIP